MNSAAQLLRKARMKAGLTQLEISRKLGFTTSQFISNLEKNKSPIPTKRIAMLCKLLKIDQKDLFVAMTKDMVERLTTEMKAKIAKHG